MNVLVDFLQNKNGKSLLERFRKLPEISINTIQSLEREYPEAPIKELLKLAEIQQKNQTKIPEINEMVFSEKGVQQASSSLLASYHALKFSSFPTCADLCCGNGMDLVKIAVGKTRVYAVDNDETALDFARYNAEVAGLKNVIFLCQPAEQFDHSVEAIFADPDRRPSNQRKVKPEEITPALGVLLELRKLTENMAIKLSPAMDYHKLPIPVEHTFEFVSENGTLKEILLCLGSLATPGVVRKAVLLPQNKTLINRNISVPVVPKGKYIFEPDKAIIRAGLVQECAQELGLNLLNERLALLTGDAFLPTDLGRFYQIREQFDYDIKKLKQYCRNEKIGELVIKTRGFPLTVEEFRRRAKFKLAGKNKMVLFILRTGNAHIMVLAEEIVEKSA